MGDTVVPEPKEQSWDQSIKEMDTGEDTAESERAPKLFQQPAVSPQCCPQLYPPEESDSHTTPIP